MTDTTGAEGAENTPQDAAAAPQEPAGQQQPPEGQGDPQEPQDAAEHDPQEPQEGGNREAAKYRTQLRTAEATIADHEAHIAELQQFVIAGLISDRVADPKVFEKLVDRDAWSGEDGRIDLNKLDAAVGQLLAVHPSLKPAGLPRPRTAPKPGTGEPSSDRTAPKPLSAIDKAFPKAGATMQNLLEKHPESGTTGDTMQQKNKNRQIKGKIGGEDG